MKKTILLLALSAFLFGCINLWTHEQAIRNSGPGPDFSQVAPNASDPCYDTGPCLCMRCVNKTHGWIFTEVSLLEGRCEFVQCTNEEAFPGDPKYIDNLLEEENSYIKTFFIGQGSTYAEFDEANKYAKSSLTLLTKWLVRTDGQPPFKPSPQRTKCYLDYNVVPAYIIYTNGQNFDVTYAFDLASSFKEAGPVILAPEARFDSSVASQVAAQAVAMKSACPNCLIALIPKDEQAVQGVDAVMQIAGASNIDILGRGLILNERTGKDPPCDFEEAVLMDLTNFSRAMLAKYHKPTMVFYYGASEGGACGFSANDTADFQEYLMTNIPMLEAAGIIGISMAQFQDRTPILGGSDSKFGVLNLDPAETQKHPRFNVWANRTRTYFTPDDETGDPQVPIAFSYNGKEGEMCKFLMKYDMSSLQKPDYLSPQYTSAVAPDAIKFECDSKNPNVIGKFNHEFVGAYTAVPVDMTSFRLAVKSGAEACDLDEYFVRSVLAVDFGSVQLDQIGGLANDLCERWGNISKFVVDNRINTTLLENDFYAKQKIAFFTALSHNTRDNIAAQQALYNWNYTKLSNPGYDAHIYVCDQADSGGFAAVIKNDYPCRVAATRNSIP